MTEVKMETAQESDRGLIKKLSKVSISFKILIVTQLTTLLVLLISAIVSFNLSRDAIETKIFDQLTSVREIKGQQIEDYVESIERQIVTYSGSPAVIDAMQLFRNAFDKISVSSQRTSAVDVDALERLDAYYRDEFFPRLEASIQDKAKLSSTEDFIPQDGGSIKLQQMFISDNPNETGQKHQLDSVDRTLYSTLHAQYHPVIRDYLEKFGYYDIFLVDHISGKIVYSVFKEVDFATSLRTGPYKDTNFARVFEAASKADDPDFIKLVDFEPYAPSYNAPASFIASPIFDGDAKVGVLVFQMPIDRINDIMTSNQSWESVGLGKSGETYVVGQDFSMRNQSRFLIEDPDSFHKIIQNISITEQIKADIRNLETTIGLLPILTEGSKRALDGQSGVAVFPDYRGVQVFSSFRPLNIEGVNWAIMSEIDESEALAPISKLKDRYILIASIMIAISIYLSFFFSRSITVSLKKLTNRAQLLAEGKLSDPVEVESADEIGMLAQSFENMRQSIGKLVDDLQGERDALEHRVTERTAELDKALHHQEEQTEELEKRNSEMLKIQDELKESEKEQIANRERLDSILQASPDGVCVIDVEGYVQLVNQSLLKTFGYESDEVIGQKINMLMPDEIAAEHDHYLERIRWGREPRLIDKGPRELHGRRKAGEQFPMELSVSQIGSGDEALFVGVLRDITERKEVEREMHEVHQIFDQMPINVFVRDSEGRYKYINRSYEEFHKRTNEEVFGKTVEEVFPDRSDVFLEGDQEVISKGEMQITDEIYETESGTLTFTVRKFPLSDTEGNIVGVAGLDIEVTEQKRMERQIAEQLAFTESLLDAVPNPIFVKDKDLRFTAMNRAYEEAFGIRREDYMGVLTRDVDYASREVTEHWEKIDTELINEGGFKREEVVAKFADGLDHELLSMRRTFELSDGNPGGMLGILIDISDRKEMEREMEVARQEAETANETKSAFLANMSHELRTPMNAIIGYAEILKEDAEDEENEEIVPDLDKIIAAGRHLLQLINDVLDISKIESGRMELYLEEFDVSEMISNAASTVTSLVEKNNNVLEIEVEENAGSMIADLTKVRQMVFNLVSNAAKFTSDGTVRIEASKFEKGGEEYIEIAVSDTGIGIPEDKLEHIFEEFSQADTSTTRNYGGTGLGLALVRRFAQMMGGDVHVESIPGSGSTFRMVIPATVVEVAGDSEDIKAETGKGPKPMAAGFGKVLVIDDDATARNLLKRILEDQGYDVILAEDGKQGLALARSEKPALITCDIMMPNIDGWEVLQVLKDDPVTEPIPVIMISMVDEGKKGISLGAVEHLRKPVNRDQLKQIVGKYVRAAGSVLIVEDDVATQDVTASALKALGIDAMIASNGQEALDILQKEKPDLVLLDLMMPVMDGFEFLEHFRKLENSEAIPVIVVTAKDLTREERQNLSKRVTHIVEKEEDYVKELLRNVGFAVKASETGE